MKLAWLVHSKPGLPDGYALRHVCQMASDVHVRTLAHLDNNNMNIIYHNGNKKYIIVCPLLVFDSCEVG